MGVMGEGLGGGCLWVDRCGVMCDWRCLSLLLVFVCVLCLSEQRGFSSQQRHAHRKREDTSASYSPSVEPPTSARVGSNMDSINNDEDHSAGVGGRLNDHSCHSNSRGGDSQRQARVGDPILSIHGNRANKSDISSSTTSHKRKQKQKQKRNEDGPSDRAISLSSASILSFALCSINKVIKLRTNRLFHCALALGVLCCHAADAYTNGHPRAFREHPASSWRQQQRGQDRLFNERHAQGSTTSTSLRVSHDLEPPSRGFSLNWRRKGESQPDPQKMESNADDTEIDVDKLLSDTEAALRAVDDMINARPSLLVQQVLNEDSEAVATRRGGRAPAPPIVPPSTTALSTTQFTQPPAHDAKVDNRTTSTSTTASARHGDALQQLILTSGIGGALLGGVLGLGLELQHPFGYLGVQPEMLPVTLATMIGTAVYFSASSLDDGILRNLLLAVFGVSTRNLAIKAQEATGGIATDALSAARDRAHKTVEDIQSFPEFATTQVLDSSKAFIEHTAEEIQTMPQRLVDDTLDQIDGAKDELVQLPQRKTEEAASWFGGMISSIKQAPSRVVENTKQRVLAMTTTEPSGADTSQDNADAQNDTSSDRRARREAKRLERGRFWRRRDTSNKKKPSPPTVPPPTFFL